MQIFQIIPLEATQRPSSLIHWPAFWGLLRYVKRGLGLHYFQLFERRKKKSQMQMYSRAPLNEFMTQSWWNTVEHVAPIQGFQQSLNSSPIRKTKGELLKATQGFELNWRHFSPQHDKR